MAFAFIVVLHTPAALAQVFRVGVLKHGAVRWEGRCARLYGLLRNSSVEVRTIEFAPTDASRVALMAGAASSSSDAS